MDAKEKFITSSLSLRPEQLEYANKRATQAGISVSALFQNLLEYDRVKNVLPSALSIRLRKGLAA